MTQQGEVALFGDEIVRPLSEEATAMGIAFMEGFMSDDDATAFANRMKEDEAFFDAVAPTVKRCQSHTLTDAEMRIARGVAHRWVVKAIATHHEAAAAGKSEPRAKRTPPSTEEVELARRYVDAEMDGDEIVAFKTRLMDDRSLFDRLAPYIKAWSGGDGWSPLARRFRKLRPAVFERIGELAKGDELGWPDDDELPILLHYLTGHLTEDEMIEFEDLLAEDDEFLRRMSLLLLTKFVRPSPVLIEEAEELKEEARGKKAPVAMTGAGQFGGRLALSDPGR